jgi:hypothetical protein
MEWNGMAEADVLMSWNTQVRGTGRGDPAVTCEATVRVFVDKMAKWAHSNIV